MNVVCSEMNYTLFLRLIVLWWTTFTKAPAFKTNVFLFFLSENQLESQSMCLDIMISYYFFLSLKETSPFSIIQCLSANWLSNVCLNNSPFHVVETSFRSKQNQSKEWSVFRNHCHVVGCVSIKQLSQIFWFMVNLSRRRRSWKKQFFVFVFALGVRGNRSVWMLRMKGIIKMKKELCMYEYVCMWIIRCHTQ